MAKEKNKKAPNLRFKGFTNDWEQRKLGDLMNVTSVKRIHQSDWQSEGIPFFRARDIVALNKGEKISEPLYISKEKYEDYSRISGKVKYNDLLVTGVGTIGIPFLVRKTPLYFKDGNIIWFQNNNKINGYFLYISFLTSSMQDYIRSSTGVGTVPTYTIKSGKETPIKYPISIEQDKITATIKRVSDIVTLQQRKLELLKEIKKGLLQKMFADKSKFPILRFEGFHDEWEQRKLGELYSYHNGKAHEQNQRSSGKYELINLNSISVDGTLKSSGRYINHADEILRQNDLVMILSDIAHGTLLGRVAIIPQDNKYVLNQRVALLRPISKSENSNFMVSLINNNQRYFHKMGIGTSQLNISKSTVIESLWQIPKIKEQSVIGNFLQNIDHIIALQHQKLAKYQSIKKSLLQQMFM